MTSDRPEEPEPFVITHDMSAPLDLVWRVHTEVEHLKAWFGPKGVDVIHSDLDLSPGGYFHYGLRSPESAEMWGKHEYWDVVPHDTLVFVQSFSDMEGGTTRHPASATWPLELLATNSFEPLAGGGTRLTIAWAPYHASAEEMATFDAAREQMRAGFEGTFERLDGYLSALAKREG